MSDEFMEKDVRAEVMKHELFPYVLRNIEPPKELRDRYSISDTKFFTRNTTQALLYRVQDEDIEFKVETVGDEDADYEKDEDDEDEDEDEDNEDELEIARERLIQAVKDETSPKRSSTGPPDQSPGQSPGPSATSFEYCLLYTSDAADDLLRVHLG